jgi:glycosyltransferase involved in cell wall biosynthesis
MVRQLNLNDVVFFQGWQDDITDFLYNKHFIVSSSIGESQGLGVLEGMSCGLKPIIHNFPGAAEIFEDKYIFNIAEQFCDMITSDDYNPSEYRAFVEKKYPQKKQFQDINNIFTSMEKSISKNNINNSSFAAAY